MQEFLNRLGVNINIAFHLVFISLIWVRVLTTVAVLPFLFGKPVPRYVVVAASMVLAVFVYPCIVPSTPVPLTQDILALVVLYLKEAFYGLAIGMSVAIIFYAFMSVGQIVDDQRGMSIARVLIPEIGQQASVSSLFFYQMGVVIYLCLGGHRFFFNSFYHSFIALPVLEFPVTGPGMFPLMDLFIHITGQVIYIAIQMAAPVIIAIFFADMILGIANRVSPQINVWMLGFQLKGYVGVLLIFVSIAIIGDQMGRHSLRSNRYVDQVVDLLKGKVPVVPEVPPPEEGLPKPEGGPPPVTSIEGP